MDQDILACRTLKSSRTTHSIDPPFFLSQPIQRRPIMLSTSPHLPVPANGSTMRAFRLANCWMKYRTSPTPCAQANSALSLGGSPVTRSVTYSRFPLFLHTNHRTGFHVTFTHFPGSCCPGPLCSMQIIHQ